MTGYLSHFAVLCALACMLVFLAWTVVQGFKSQRNLAESIERCEQILKHSKAKGEPHLKLNRATAYNHIEWKHGLHNVWEYGLRRHKPYRIRRLREAEWCQNNLTAIPTIVVSPFDELDIILTFATPDDAFAFKIRWF